MNNNSVMRLTCAALRCGFMVALLLIAALPALTQDTLSDADQCFLGQQEFCPQEPDEDRPSSSGDSGSGERDHSADSGSGSKAASSDRITGSTCRYLPSHVTVFDYLPSTQCQMVGARGISQSDRLRPKFLDAVDVWGNVPPGLEVCFQEYGSFVFFDAKHSPRMLVELEAYERDGMTCGAIYGAGTVVLLQSDMPPESAPPATPEADALPSINGIPLDGCMIKLLETLFLRDHPAGEIIGLVWQNSEVPALQISGFWYKIEFEGKTGFVSRYHRKVLRGGCG
ncbi:MAG: hypothetical protein OXI77_03145 [Chloroflexota bacterium]|nr:hypothetical protein [Chloroflexota bacterium]MDE2908815.1 hypothetical protein [Chloroflexota bacterium]